MIKEILSIFKSNTLMDRAFQRSYTMLDLTYRMFLQAKHVLRETEQTDLDFDINNEDSEVNKYQREVRKDVFKHLVLTEGEQLTSGLILVSIVIDIERIGDYTKNIVDLAQSHQLRLNGGTFENELVRIENAVLENFQRTLEVFKNSDEEAAIGLLKEFKWIGKLSDDCLTSLVKETDPNISSGSAVALALYFRSLKRINSHLGINPKRKKRIHNLFKVQIYFRP